MSSSKIERLIEAAHLYYEENMTQQAIAARLGVSRPMVSMLLREARTTGIVTITINRAASQMPLIARRLESLFSIKKAIVVPALNNHSQTDDAVTAAAYRFCFDGETQPENTGVGWGHMMGQLADYAEGMKKKTSRRGQPAIFPLIGSIGASYRGYRTNEIAALLAAQTGMKAEFLHMPAFFESEEELSAFAGTKACGDIFRRWNTMGRAIISVSNCAAYPDLGVEYRFGPQLTQNACTGRVLAHYFDVGGRIIAAKVNNVLQPSIEQLRSVPEVTAICSSLLQSACMLGMLRLNIIDTLILPAPLAIKTLELAGTIAVPSATSAKKVPASDTASTAVKA